MLAVFLHRVVGDFGKSSAIFRLGLVWVRVEGAVNINGESRADLAFAAGFLIGGGHGENGKIVAGGIGE